MTIDAPLLRPGAGLVRASADAPMSCDRHRHIVRDPRSRFARQIAHLPDRVAPACLRRRIDSGMGHFIGILSSLTVVIGALLALIYLQYGERAPDARAVIATTLWIVFAALFMLSGVLAWLLALAHRSRRAAQQESARQTAMLVGEIEARERADGELKQAREVAESANEAKSRFVVGISHEIRSPLNAILGYAQLLERGAAAPPQNAVRIIRRSAEHLARLIDDLLDISKIENGLLRLNRDRVRLADFLEQTVDMFRPQAAARGIDFDYRRPQRLPPFVYTDEKRLRQLLINLLSNAIKFTERGKVGFSLRYRNQVAEFEIADTGIGIREQDLDAIFEPFERGGIPAARMVPGAGLGLSISKMLVQIMGGEIVVRSTPGAGSTFIVRLLLSQAWSGGDEVARQRIVGYVGRRRRVLIVDDDPTHLDLLQQALSRLDFVTQTACNGETALRLAAHFRPDLVTLDITMPDINGWDLARSLRDGGCRARIMMVSANAHDERCAESDAPHDAFLAKPWDFDVMLARVGELLDVDWRYAGHPVSISEAMPAGFDRHRAELLRLGRIGHVRAIDARLREIAQREPLHAAFAARLQHLVAEFDLKTYMALLNDMSREPPP